MPDASKSLGDLHEAWQGCTRCPLGQRREEVGGRIVFGEGAPRAVLFIGEGPGVEEEATGRPFVGRSGQVLRMGLEKIGLENVYISNLVACRSCEPLLDAHTGEVVMREDRRTRRMLPVIVDRPPPPAAVSACRERLLDEIYLVDPVLIVTLGAEAAEALLGHPVAITRERGEPEHIEIPGALYRPVLTEKKKAWVRRVRGDVTAPVERGWVRYLVLPTVHPAYVLKRGADKGPSSPTAQFGRDLRRARDIYDRYCVDVYGHEPRRYGPEHEGDIHVQEED